MFDDTNRPAGVISHKLQNFNSDQILRLIESKNGVVSTVFVLFFIDYF
jgi:hypothetical protein